MIDIRLKVFVSVAHNLSFTRAAKELFITQPAVSKHINELEQSYKVRLFKRKGSHIQLTNAGELLLTHAEPVLHAYRHMDFEMNLLTQSHTGELRLGASTTIAQYILPSYLSQFMSKFPDIKLSLLNGNSAEIERALIEERIDLALVEGCRQQPILHYSPFMKDELVVVANPNGKYGKYDELTMDELRKLPLVIRENGSGSLEVFEDALTSHGQKLSSFNVIIQLGSTEGIKRFLETADAIGVISIAAVTRELVSERLKVIDIIDFSCCRTFHSVRNQGEDSGIGGDFVRFITKDF